MDKETPHYTISAEKKRFLWKVSHPDTLPAEELIEILRYILKLLDLYEEYILSKGIRYINEADQFVQEHGGTEFPLL